MSNPDPTFARRSGVFPSNSGPKSYTDFAPNNYMAVNGDDFTESTPKEQYNPYQLQNNSPDRMNNSNRGSLRGSEYVQPTDDTAPKSIACNLNELQSRFVLSCIEIDRLVVCNSLLTKEVEYWKDKSKNQENNGPTPAQYGEVAQLRIRNAELESKLAEINKDLKRSGSINSYPGGDQDKEIQKLKTRVAELEGYLAMSSSPKGLEEFQKIREDLERKLLASAAENERVNSLLTKKIKECDDAQAKLLALKIENDKLIVMSSGLGEVEKLRATIAEKEKEAATWKDKYNELYAKSGGLMAECDKLNSILTQKSEFELSTIKVLQEKLKTSEEKVQALQAELKKVEAIKRDKDVVDGQFKGATQKIRELEDIINKMSQEIYKLQDQLRQAGALEFTIKQLQAKLAESDEKNKQLGNEIQRLNEELRKKMDLEFQLKQAQMKNKENEERIAFLNSEIQRLSALSAAKLELEKTVQALRLKIKEYEERISKLENLYREYEDRMAKLQGENNRLLAEIERLKAELMQMTAKEQELEEWKRMHDELGKKAKKDLEVQKSHLDNHHNNRLENQKRAAAAQLNNQDQKIKDLEKQLAQALEELKKRDARIKELETLVATLQIDNQRIPILVQDLENWKAKYLNLEKTSKEEQIRMKQQFDAILSQKIQEERAAADMKIKIIQDDYEAKLKALLAENKKLTTELDQLKARIPKIKEEVKAEVEAALKAQFDVQMRDTQAKYEAQILDLKARYETQIREQQTKFEIQMREMQAKYELQIRELQNRLEREKTEYELNTKQLKSKIAELEAKCQSLAQEIERLKALILEKENEIVRLKKYVDLEALVRSLNQQLDQYKRRAEDAESELVKARAEVKRLQDVVLNKDEEIQMLKQRCDQIQKEAQDYVNRTLEEFNKQLKNALDKQKAEYEEKIRVLNQKISELELRIAQLMNENENLKNMIKDLRAEIENWKNKYASLDQSRLAEIEDLKLKMKKMEQEFEAKYQIKITKLETSLRDSERRDSQLDVTIKNLLEENSRLSNLSVQRLKEIDNLRIKYAQGVDQDKMALEQLEACRRQLMESRDLVNRLEGDKRNLEAQLQRLNQAYEASQAEIKRLNSLLDQKSRELEDLRRQYEQIKLDTLSFRNQDKELKLLADKYQEALKEIENIQRTRDIYKRELEKYTTKDKQFMTELIIKDNNRW